MRKLKTLKKLLQEALVDVKMNETQEYDTLKGAA